MSNSEDRKMLGRLSKERLLELFFLQIRNLWRVDGLYFLGIEERFGAEAATEIDARCWEIMGKTEARHLRTILEIGEIDPESLIHILRNTSWALDVLEKEIEITERKAVFRVTKCGTQLTRRRKGLEVFPCKKVRLGYMRSFAQELNPKIETRCKVCPPDERPPDLWCEWEFMFPER
ncbi:MAG: hypothetical protein JSW53_04650 [Candidatus Bathyarchaeota archaeon]|nr:MAG: hypothetical protein JSW53_04650 [Candidatus Bathyarchaeota archaeon]